MPFIASLYAGFQILADDDDHSPAAAQLSSQSRVLTCFVDIFIAAVIVVFILLRLPRAAARFWKTSELTSGHFLLSKSGVDSLEEGNDIPKETQAPTSDGCSGQGARIKHSYPPHYPAYPALLQPLVRSLPMSILPRYSNSQVIIMLGYFGVLLFALVYHNNFLTIPIRPSWIVVSQLPILYGFSAKNNVVGWLMGLGYQNLNYFHRFAGRLIVLAVNVHAVVILYRWSLVGKISTMFQIPSHRWGATALISMDIIFLFSFSVWRTKQYKIFRITHVVGYLLIVPAVYKHQHATLPYILAIAAIYLSDRVFALSKTHLVTAIIRPMPSLSSTWIEIKSLNYGWRAGQHVRIRILSTSLGRIDWTEAHPFTIASAPAISRTEDALGIKGLILICKKTGGWTIRLFEMANAPSHVENGTVDDVGADKTVRLLVEGPYGGPGHAIFASYTAVVIIAGGSGITFALSTIQDLVQKGLNSESRVRAIELIWVVRYKEAITSLVPLFSSLMNACSYLSITVRYTRIKAPQPGESSENVGNQEGSSHDSSSSNPNQTTNGPSLVVQPGRPERANFVNVMEKAITDAISRNTAGHSGSDSGGLLVGVCGPPGLEKDVVPAVEGISTDYKVKIGGVEVHIESFEL